MKFARGSETRIVDQQVDRAPLAFDPLENHLGRVALTQIGLDQKRRTSALARRFLGHRVQAVLASCDEYKVVFFLAQRVRESLAEPAGCAGYECGRHIFTSQSVPAN